MKLVVNKVAAYITRRHPQKQMDQLLIFRHTQHPEAGLQVPAGTLREGEDTAVGALREAREESGLQALSQITFLGTRDFDCTPWKDQIHHRFFYHFEAVGELPETWRHHETDPSDQSALSYEFEFFWADLPWGVPKLMGEQNSMIPALMNSLEQLRLIR